MIGNVRMLAPGGCIEAPFSQTSARTFSPIAIVAFRFKALTVSFESTVTSQVWGRLGGSLWGGGLGLDIPPPAS